MSSLLCAKGGKKKKKNARDSSPPYRPDNRKLEDRITELEEELRSTKEENEQLKTDLKEKTNSCRVAKQEVSDLKHQLRDATEKTAGAKDDIKNITKLESVVLQVHADKKQHSAKDVEKGPLSEEIQSSQKALEHERKARQEAEAKLTKDLQAVKDEREKEKKDSETKLLTTAKHLDDAKQELEKEKKQRIELETKIKTLEEDQAKTKSRLQNTEKELEIARRESHIPRSPTRPPTDEWKSKIEHAESELKKERQSRLDKEKEISRLVSEKEGLDNQLKALQADYSALNAKFEEVEKRGKDSVDGAESEKQILQQTIEGLQSEVEALKNAKKDTELNHINDLKRVQDTNDNLRRSLRETEAAKEKLLTRLSSQTAAQVLDNNPNVADLSDPNRPQKLGELLSQLYDDQWTDATEILEKMDKEEDEILKILLNLLIFSYKHCKEAAESQISRIEEDLFLPPLDNSAPNGQDTGEMEHLKSPTSSKHSSSKIPRFTSHKGRPALPNISTEKKTVDNDSGTKDKDKSKKSSVKVKGEKLPEIPVEIRKGIKEYRKKITKQVCPVIQKEVFNKLRKSEFEDKVIDECKAYIEKCVELCWLMRVQDPPVVLTWDVPEDQKFNLDVYRAYTKSGSHVEYVVWPAMYLHEDGPLMAKGVAQGCRK